MNPRLKELWNVCQMVREDGKNSPFPLHCSDRGDVSITYEKDGEIIIAVDGSDSAEEWISNFMFFSLNRDRCHTGFRKAAHELYEQYKPLVKKNIPFLITAHSRGGGIVQELGRKLAIDGAMVQVVTFGSPKVGREWWRKSMYSNGVVHIRVVAENDPVTKIVPWLKHYDTECVILQHKDKSLVDTHTKYGEML